MKCVANGIIFKFLWISLEGDFAVCQLPYRHECLVSMFSVYILSDLNEMGMVCGAYGRGERGAQGVGGET
jgi:hypothetical protein